MDYEAFTARANCVFDDCSKMKRMLWNAQSVVGAVPGMVRKNERLEKEKAELKQENAALKAGLDDWKGNAEGFEPDAYMRLPVDADGVPIRIGDKVWYVGGDLEIEKSEPQKVEGLVSVFAADGTYIMIRDYTDKAVRPNMLTHNPPEPPDSWEKLEEDAKVKACDYAHAPRDEYGGFVCRECRFQKSESCQQAMIIDMIARAKKLAGIEDEQR